MKTFMEQDCILNDKDDTIGENNNYSNTNLIPVANNQKSMLIVESLFIIKCLKELALTNNTRINLLYIGGSPGDHINNLAEMFPMITFHVYDSLEMPKIVEKDNLIKYQENFEVKRMSKSITGTILMISDIRNKNYDANPRTDEEIVNGATMIIEDMEMQKKWFHEIKPAFALLRFRPLLHNEAKLINQSSFSYLTGIHYLLPYSKSKTNSTMLMVQRDATEALYFHNDVLNRIKYHNISIRNNCIYLNPYSRIFEALVNLDEVRKLDIKVDLGYEHYIMNYGWDCRYAYFVFYIYLKEIRGMTKVPKEILDRFIVSHFSQLENKE